MNTKPFHHCLVACLSVLACLLTVLPARAQGYVQSDGTALSLGGVPFTPHGVNLGNWFVLEPYMVGGGSSNEQVRQAFLTLAGGTANYQAWRATYLSNYVTQADIQRLHTEGFNTVRVPLDWRDFVDAGGNAVNTGLYGNTLPANAPFGLTYLDQLLSWCTAADIYVLPDMHTTPSTVDNNSEIYVSSTSQVSSTLNQVKAAWATIAQRYQSTTNILGYDLLNEPPGNLNNNKDYLPTYQQIQTVIRQYDANHLLVLEGNQQAYLGDSSIDSGHGIFGNSAIDPNMAISIHNYGGNPLPPASIDADNPNSGIPSSDSSRSYYAWDYANRLNVPLVIGETGENNNNWVNGIVHLWSVGKVGNNGSPLTAGVLYWTYKKPGDSVRAVVSVPFVSGWSAIENYLNNGGTVPNNALSLLMAQASVGAYANETLHPDVVDALQRDYTLSGPIPFPVTALTIPGTINAVDYDMGLVSPTAMPGDYSPFAYFSANPQTITYQVRDDRVGTYLNNGLSVVGDNNAGDWQNYTVNISPGTYQVFLDYGAPSGGAQIGLTLNGTPLLASGSLPATGGSQTYQETQIGSAVPITTNGPATLRITTLASGLDYVHVRFTTLTGTAAANFSGFAGQTVMLNGALTSGGIGVSGKTLTFKVDGSAVGSGTTNANGAATYSYLLPGTLTVGGHTLTAVFGGDGTDTASTGSATLTVTQAPTTTGLTSSLNPSQAGQSVKFTVTVAPTSPGTGVPTGTVIFNGLSGNPSVTLTNGTGSYTTSALPVGATIVKAVYSGDTSFTGSNKSVTQTVNQATVTGVAASWGTQKAALTPGASLLPTARKTDVPWLGVSSFALTLSAPAALTAADVSVTGSQGGSYGPVTVTISGTNCTVTLARPVLAADVLTLTVGNTNIATLTGTLPVLPGDVSDDGLVNIQDAVLVRNMYLFGPLTPPTVYGDINGDGTVSIADYTLARQRIGARLP